MAQLRGRLANKALATNQCLIAGAWVDAKNHKIINVTNPADGSVVGTVPDMGAGETRKAIAAAADALESWKSKTGKERAGILRAWYDLIIANTEDLALIMTLEQGKPLAEARGEIAYAASFIEWFGEEAKRVYGTVIPSHIASARIIVQKQPVGVCAAITPWNFPAAMITRKAGAALAAGCTMVVKPASQTPLTALALGKLAMQAGIPDGVLNIITGDAKTIGGELTANPTVRKLSFTGSTSVGKTLMKQCADTMKRISLELGGNAPFIVFDDANIEQAVAGAMSSKFRNSGQTCVCANRIYVQDKIYDEFVELLTAQVKKLRVGSGDTKGITQGPLIDEKALKKVEALIADACNKGAQVVCGGKPHAKGGLFFQPTVLSHVTSKMKLAKEEIFGPVAAVFRFKTDDEAIARANDTEYGLASYFYARDLSRVWRVAEKLEYGMVAVNEGMLSTEVAPFGGIKESGIGREGSFMGIDEYVDTKYILMGGVTA